MNISSNLRKAVDPPVLALHQAFEGRYNKCARRHAVVALAQSRNLPALV